MKKFLISAVNIEYLQQIEINAEDIEEAKDIYKEKFEEGKIATVNSEIKHTTIIEEIKGQGKILQGLELIEKIKIKQN